MGNAELTSALHLLCFGVQLNGGTALCYVYIGHLKKLDTSSHIAQADVDSDDHC
jgi:hypothetical protein